MCACVENGRGGRPASERKVPSCRVSAPLRIAAHLQPVPLIETKCDSWRLSCRAFEHLPQLPLACCITRTCVLCGRCSRCHFSRVGDASRRSWHLIAAGVHRHGILAAVACITSQRRRSIVSCPCRVLARRTKHERRSIQRRRPCQCHHGRLTNGVALCGVASAGPSVLGY